MTDQPKPGTVAWLRENARFQCLGCSRSRRATDLRQWTDKRICNSCHGRLSRRTRSRWDALQPFGDPFARLEEAERLLSELVRETGIERVEGLPWLNAQIDPELWAEVQKWSTT